MSGYEITYSNGGTTMEVDRTRYPLEPGVLIQHGYGLGHKWLPATRYRSLHRPGRLWIIDLEASLLWWWDLGLHTTALRVTLVEDDRGCMVARSLD